MKRICLGLLLALGLAAALPAAAQTIEEQVVRQLRAQGFTEISIERTLLGRIRIEAESVTHEREIVINPSTGAILRDYWEARDNDGDGPRLVDPRNDDQSDNPGSGSGSSGSGSGNSGSGSSDDGDGEDDDDDGDDKDDDDDGDSDGDGDKDDDD